MKKRTTVNAINLTPKIKAQFPVPSTTSEYMKTLYIVNEETKIFNKLYGHVGIAKKFGELMDENYVIEKFKAEDLFEDSTNIDAVEGFNTGVSYFFMKIPRFTVANVDKIVEEIQAYDRGKNNIYYVVNLTETNIQGFMYEVSSRLAAAPFYKNIMVVDKVSSFIIPENVSISTEDSLIKVFEACDAKAFKTCYIPRYHSEFVIVTENRINFWDVNTDCTFLLDEAPQEYGNNRFINFFVGPMLLKDGTLGLKKTPGTAGIVDLQGTIFMFWLGMKLQNHSKNSPINKDDIPFVISLNSSTEMFDGIDYLLTGNTYKMSILANKDNDAEGVMIDYVRTQEVLYKELEEMITVECADAINILTKNIAMDYSEKMKDIDEAALNDLRLALENMFSKVNGDPKLGLSGKLVKSASVVKIFQEPEYQDLVRIRIKVVLYSLVGDTGITLYYTI